MTAPTFVSVASTNHLAGPASRTMNVVVQTGDLIVVTGGAEDEGRHLSPPTAPGYTFTERQSIEVFQYPTAYVWTAVAPASATVTLTFAVDPASPNYDPAYVYSWGVTVYVWRNHGGVGVSGKANVNSGAPSLSLTTGAADSALIVKNSDWNALDGAARTWRFAGVTATESHYFRDAAKYATYGAYHVNAGAAGAKTVGLTTPASQKYSIVGLEVLGVTSSGSSVVPEGIGSVGWEFGSVVATAGASAGPSELFNPAREGFLSAEIDWDSATIKVALVRNYTFNPAHRFVSDITGAGGVIHATSGALTSKTIVNGSADAADVMFGSLTPNSSGHSLLVFQSSAVTGGADVAASSQRVIAWITGGDLPTPIVGGALGIAWDNGPLKIFTIWRGTPPPPAGTTVSPTGFTIAPTTFGTVSISNPGTGGGTTALPGWRRTASNTGLAAKGVTSGMLTDYNGPFNIPANTTLTRRRLNLGNSQLVLGANVQLIECEINSSRVGSQGSIRGPLYNESFGGQRMLWCDINGPNSTAGESMGFYSGNAVDVQIVGCKINGMTIGIWLDTQPGGASTQSIIDQCFITTYTQGGAHKDGFTRRAGQKKLIVSNSRFFCDGQAVTGAVIIQDTFGGNDLGNIDFDKNYFEGSGYLLTINPPLEAPLTVTDCRFRPTLYGIATTSGYNFPVWTDNYIYNSADPLGRGSFVPEPQ